MNPRKAVCGARVKRIQPQGPPSQFEGGALGGKKARISILPLRERERGGGGGGGGKKNLAAGAEASAS
jgi:hypothetical protein